MTNTAQEQIAGLWSLADGEPAEVARWDVGAAAILVPTEDVLLLAVDLPSAAGDRRAALPFAVEDRIADAIEAVHVVLGPPLGTGTYLAAVVRHDVMAAWTARLAAAGLGHARIVPDALLLPVPPAGAWHVWGTGGRIVARTDTGTGLAAPADSFAALWAAGGSLPCLACGPADGIGVPVVGEAAPPDFAALAVSPPLDLRTGSYAAPQPALPRAMRRAAAIVGLGLLAHTALLAADAAATTHAAAAQRRTTTALLATLPGHPAPADLDRLLPGGRSRLLPALARAAATLAPVGRLGWTRVAWSAADDRLTLGVEAPDMAGLQRAAAALAAAGLDPVSGAVTTGENRTDGEFVLRKRDA